MKKMGRPKKPKSEQRLPGFAIRLTQGEEQVIASAVKSSGLARSDWARKSLLHIAKEGICIT